MASTTRESKTILTAEDATKSAFDSMIRSATSAQSSITSLQGAFAALAGGAAVGFFGSMIKRAIDAGEEMNKLAQKTGIAVEQLSELSYAAKISDVSTEVLGKGIKGLSETMVAASNPLTLQAKLLRELGVSAGGDTLTALEQIAGQFATMPDGATKSALATELFKKAGLDLIPMLNQGSDGIVNLRKDAVRLGLTFTSETARASEQFNDSITTLKASSGKLGISLANELLPSLNSITSAMIEARKDSSLLYTLWVGLGGIGAMLFTNDTLSDAQKFRKEITALNEQLALQNQRLREAADLQGRYGENTRKAVGAGRDQTLLRLMQSGNELDANIGGAQLIQKRAEEKKVENERYRSLLAGSKSAADEIAKHNEEMRKKDTQGWIKFIEDFYEESKKADLAYAAFAEANNEREAKQQKLATDALNKYAEEQAKALDTLRESIGQRELEIATFGMSRQAATEYAAALLEAQIATITLDEATEAQIETMRAQAQMMRELAGKEGQLEGMQKQVREQEAAFRSWFDLVDDGFKAALNGAKSFGDYLKNSLKNILYQLIARPFVIQIAATLSGSSAQTMANVLGGQGGGAGSIVSSLTSLSSIINGAGSMFASAGSLFGSSAISAFGAGMQGATLGAGLAGPTTVGAGGAMGAGASVAAAIPYVAIAAAVYALYKSFAPPGGGPKQEGSYIAGYSSSGAFSGESNHRMYATNELAGSFNNIVTATSARYFDALKLLGGSVGGVHFGMGGDRDPRGTAPGTISALAGVNGVEIFREIRNIQNGLSAEQTEAEYLTTTNRMMLAALQKSALPQYLANVLDDVVAAGASTDQVNGVIARAIELRTAYESIEKAIEGIAVASAQLGGDTMAVFRAQLNAMRAPVMSAALTYQGAIGSGDLSAINAAQIGLTKAILERYNTEFELVSKLRDTLRSINVERYDAAKSMDARYAALGINRDPNGQRSWDFAKQIRRGELDNNTTSPQERLTLIDQYLKGADDWFAAHQKRIQQGGDEWRAIVDRQRGLMESQLAAQQAQLQATQAMADFAQQAADSIKSLSLTDASPASQGVRYSMAGQNIAMLQDLFASTSGQTKIDYGQKLLSAAQERLSMAGSMYQRPSEAYVSAYNETIGIMSRVQQSATESASALPSIQQSIAATEAALTGLAGTMASIDSIVAQQLEVYQATYKQALDYASGEQALAYNQMQATATAQLTEITSGRNATEYLATLTRSTNMLLGGIGDRLQEVLDRVDGPATPANITVTVANTTTSAGGGNVVVLTEAQLAEAIADAVSQAVTQTRREMAYS